MSNNIDYEKLAEKIVSHLKSTLNVNPYHMPHHTSRSMDNSSDASNEQMGRFFLPILTALGVTGLTFSGLFGPITDHLFPRNVRNSSGASNEQMNDLTNSTNIRSMDNSSDASNEQMGRFFLPILTALGVTGLTFSGLFGPITDHLFPRNVRNSSGASNEQMNDLTNSTNIRSMDNSSDASNEQMGRFFLPILTALGVTGLTFSGLFGPITDHLFPRNVRNSSGASNEQMNDLTNSTNIRSMDNSSNLTNEQMSKFFWLILPAIIPGLVASSVIAANNGNSKPPIVGPY